MGALFVVLAELPRAYVGILDNNASKRYRRDGLQRRLADTPHHEGVEILWFLPAED